MKPASISELRRDLDRILESLAEGEEVAITKHNQTGARKLPAVREKRKPVKMPDVTARLQKVFGNKVISDRDIRQLWA